MSSDSDILELEQLDSELAMSLPLIGNSLHEALSLLQVAYEWQPALRQAIHEMKMLQIYRDRESDDAHREQHVRDLQEHLSVLKNDSNMGLVRDSLVQAEAILVGRQQVISQLLNHSLLRG